MKDIPSCSVAVVGTGRIGLDLAYSLILAGHRVTLIARSNYESLRRRGFYHYEPSHPLGVAAVPPSMYNLCRTPGEAGKQDVIFITTGADDLLGVSKLIAPMLGRGTCVVSASNGLPVWFPACNSTIPSYTTGENLKRFEDLVGAVDLSLMVGGVIERGVSIRAKFGRQIVTPHIGNVIHIGELSGGSSARVSELCKLLPARCPLHLEQTSRLPLELWKKLAFNLRVNPPAAIYGSRIAEVFKDLALNAIGDGALGEFKHLGQALGIIQPENEREYDLSLGSIIAESRDSLHVPSTALDIRNRKTPELFPLVGAALEYARAWNQTAFSREERIDLLPLEMAGLSIMLGWFNQGKGARINNFRHISADLLPELETAYARSNHHLFVGAGLLVECCRALLKLPLLSQKPCDKCFAYDLSRMIRGHIDHRMSNAAATSLELAPSVAGMREVAGRIIPHAPFFQPSEIWLLKPP